MNADIIKHDLCDLIKGMFYSYSDKATTIIHFFFKQRIFFKRMENAFL